MGLDWFSTSLHCTAVHDALIVVGNYSYYLLSRQGEIENWVATERSLGSVELSWIGRCDHYYGIYSTQLDTQPNVQSRRTCDNWTSWVESQVVITTPDPSQLNWFRSGAVIRALRLNCTIINVGLSPPNSSKFEIFGINLHPKGQIPWVFFFTKFGSGRKSKVRTLTPNFTGLERRAYCTQSRQNW